MAPKRKRESAPAEAAPAATTAPPTETTSPETIHLQVITGTYEKTLHGFIASIPLTPAPTTPSTGDLELPTTFTDTFLFTAHTSPLRTLTLSPIAPNSTKRFLATSSADERTNLYTLSTTLPPLSTSSLLRPLTGGNKNLGTLHHHVNTPTSLIFTPNRQKLITAGADGNINIIRTRDWSLLSTLKAPKPKPKPVNYAKDYGEYYGPRIEALGSEGYGGSAGGINDIALHPSQKILLSVGTKERSVRMWNLMTGRKAGVLKFEKGVVPREFGSEGIKVEWNQKGDEYAVCFDRGVVVFDMESKPRAHVVATGRPSRIHQMRYVVLPAGVVSGKKGEEEGKEYLTISTDDGRVLFFDTKRIVGSEAKEDKEDDALICGLEGTLGGREMGMPGRVKDFVVMEVGEKVFVITAGSDGSVRVWDLTQGGMEEVAKGEEKVEKKVEKKEEGKQKKKAKMDKKVEEKPDVEKKEEAAPVKGDKQVGRLVGIYQTARRITCMAAMTMVEREGGVQEDEEEEQIESSEEEDTDEE